MDTANVVCGRFSTDLLDPDTGYIFRLTRVSGDPKCLGPDVGRMVEIITHSLVSLGGVEGVEEVVIGSTFANLRAGKRLDAMDPSSMLRRGIAGRWRQTYEPEGFAGLIVLTTCTLNTLSSELIDWGLNGLDLARIYERALDIEGRKTLPIKGEEIAGGGRLGEEVFDYGLVYAAIKLKSRDNPDGL